MRIVLDTNVLVCALTTRGLCTELFEQIVQMRFLETSEPILTELDRILSDKFGLPSTIVRGFLNLIREEADLLVVANESLPKIPDPDDIKILAYASGGQSNIFVTGDKALLDLKAIGGMIIISPRECWVKLKTPQ